jgi:hypothetical protein
VNRTTKLDWTRHALRQLATRTSLECDRVQLYFALEAAVQSRLEDNGTSEWVIFSPADKDCFAVIMGRDSRVITVMPIKWRKIAPGFIDEARELYKAKMEEEYS